MIKTFNWLDLGNKCEIYVFTKKKKKKKRKKKGITADITIRNLSYRFSKRKEKQKYDMSEISLFQSKKQNFLVKWN